MHTYQMTLGRRECRVMLRSICAFAKMKVCVGWCAGAWVCVFTCTGELTRKHASSRRQKSKLCATRRCECPVVKRAAISREKGRPLVRRTEPACVHLGSMWERVLIFNFIILPIP